MTAEPEPAADPTGPAEGLDPEPEPAADPTGPAETHPHTKAIRAGRANNDTALAPILWATSTFTAPGVDEAHAFACDVAAPKYYGRNSNPTVADFEDAMAVLEGAEAARAFASGMGAVSAVVLGVCSAGDHIVAQRQLYAHTQLLFEAVCPRFGIDVSFVDCTRPGAFAEAVIPARTTLVYAESPANPKLALVDMDELGAIAGPVTVVDATFATPLGLRPLDHGVDLSLHSATKAIAGHNDAILGVVSGTEELISWIRGFAVLAGANASPFDALNGLRGLRTLAVRLGRQSATAALLAELLEGHRAVQAVSYPGLESHPQHELACEQLQGFGGLIAFDLHGGREAGVRFVDRLGIVQLASSLGGPETLVTHPASTTHVGLGPDELAAAGIGEGTVRLSCGLEHPDDLAADVRAALDALC